VFWHHSRTLVARSWHKIQNYNARGVMNLIFYNTFEIITSVPGIKQNAKSATINHNWCIAWHCIVSTISPTWNSESYPNSFRKAWARKYKKSPFKVWKRTEDGFAHYPRQHNVLRTGLPDGKNPNLGKIWRALICKRLRYFTAIWNIHNAANLYILWPCSIYFPRFGILCQDKSGNPGFEKGTLPLSS
jgi:hypothetical protein